MAGIKLYENTDFKLNKSKWTEIRDFFEGEKEVLISPEYLVMHQLEYAPNGGAKIRQTRQQISEYTNYLGMIVQYYLSMMFKNPADISEVKAIFGDHADNVDGEGSSVQTFIKDGIAKNLILYGRPIVRTDTYAIDAASAADEAQKGQRPLWKMIEPLDAPDWVRSESKLKMFRHEYLQEDEREDLTTEPKERRYSRLYKLEGNSLIVRIFRSSQSSSAVSEKERREAKPGSSWEQIDEKVLPLSVIPIASTWKAKSWVYGVTREQRRYWNLDSVLDNVVHYQGYDIRVATGVTENNQKVAMSEYTLLFLPDGATLEKLPPTYPQAIFEKVDRSKQNIFQIAFNALRLPSSGSQEMEGEGTLRERKEDMISFIQSQIEVIETVANEAVSHWALMSGQKPPTGKIKLSRKITLKDIDQMIAIFGAMRDELRAYPKWKQKTLKQIAAAQGFEDDEEITQELEKPVQQPQQTLSDRPRLADLINVRPSENGSASARGA